MEVLEFYWVSIFAGMALLFTFSEIGRHLVARNQSMDVLLLGQEFQTSILISSFFLAIFEDGGHHDEHSFHVEALIALGLTLLIHSFYIRVLRKNRQYKIEGAIALIVLLMCVGHFVVAFSPLVEFHMVKSFLGDIVTVSKVEAIFVGILSLVSWVVLFWHSKSLKLDTLEIAIFNKLTKKRKSQLLFNIVVIVLMLFSIHLFGTLFTVGGLILPALIAGVFKLRDSKLRILSLVNSLCVPLAFTFLMDFDRFPTTVLIIFLITIISIVFSFIFKENS